MSCVAYMNNNVCTCESITYPTRAGALACACFKWPETMHHQPWTCPSKGLYLCVCVCSMRINILNSITVKRSCVALQIWSMDNSKDGLKYECSNLAQYSLPSKTEKRSACLVCLCMHDMHHCVCCYCIALRSVGNALMPSYFYFIYPCMFIQ